jgi:phosphoribosylformylglycinamidine cyclo-ligase
MSKLTYKDSGVNYDLLDKLKRMAQVAGKETFQNLSDFTIEKNTQGESATVISLAGQEYSLAFVQEGLGTKNLVADEVGQFTEHSHYDAIAQDTIAMIINDLITVGAKPVSVMAYWAIGSAEWLENETRLEDLVSGWKNACTMSGVAWTGGETPLLSGIIDPSTVDLAGAAFGIIHKDHLVDGSTLQAGDAIILFESSGIHANGLSLARKLAEQLPDGYKTTISDGRTYGEALLDPTIIYSKLIQDLFKNNIEIHYMANITGHGWRKLMRNKKELMYRITEVPPVPPVLQFIQEQGELSDEEAYGNLNMGAGFALFVPQQQVQKILEVSSQNNIKAYHAGNVEEGKKQVIIEPKNVTFSAESLQVRV